MKFKFDGGTKTVPPAKGTESTAVCARVEMAESTDQEERAEPKSVRVSY